MRRDDEKRKRFTKNTIEMYVLCKQEETDVSLFKLILSKMKLNKQTNTSIIRFALNWAPLFYQVKFNNLTI